MLQSVAMIEVYASCIDSLKNQALYEKAYNMVSPERREKANRFRFVSDKLLCIGAELLLMKALHSEKALQFTYSENLKPYLSNRNEFFNLSHSGDYVMCAVSDSEVGCDIEKIEKVRMNVAKRFFSEKEYEFINKSDNPDLAFCRIWTIKESYMKATGTGLCNDIASIEIDFAANRVNGLYFKEFDSIPGYCCTVCSSLEKIKGTSLITADPLNEV